MEWKEEASEQDKLDDQERKPSSKKRKVEEVRNRDKKGEGTADQERRNEDEQDRLHQEWENRYLECAFDQMNAMKHIINQSHLAKKILGDGLKMMLEKKREYQEKK